MSIAYCPHCGAKNEYSLQKPDSCKKCSKRFSSAFSASKSSPSPKDSLRAQRLRERRNSFRSVPEDIKEEFENEDDPYFEEIIVPKRIARVVAKRESYDLGEFVKAAERESRENI